MEPTQIQANELVLCNEITQPISFVDEPKLCYLDLPIALRKASKKCNHHPSPNLFHFTN